MIHKKRVQFDFSFITEIIPHPGQQVWPFFWRQERRRRTGVTASTRDHGETLTAQARCFWPIWRATAEAGRRDSETNTGRYWSWNAHEVQRTFSVSNLRMRMITGFVK